ncbi:MAG: TIGR03560 family F420-dependent LLM class oxidoreductase [Chloroflexota bacterium]|nr:TIGR03560 family F420-dependent LLM class oxidoreductase [Chloroflexota bacterium]
MHLDVNLWPQNTTWQTLREHALLADRLGFSTLWVWDHFYSISGDLHRPNLEGWQVQAAYAAITKNVRIGCLVSGITHRHPAVLANMATTLDNISGGRAILGIGAAWNALEHNAYGIDLGTPSERSNRFAEAAKIIRQLVDGKRVTFSGKYYELVNAEVLVRPVQKRLPILIGGGGEQRTLRTTARYADMWHAFETPEVMAHKIEVLRKHCADVGRDPAEIEPIGGSWVVIRDDPAKAKAHLQRVAQHHGMSAPPTAIVGGPDQVAEKIAEHARVGVKGFIVRFAEPFDAESMERLATEVRPRLERILAETPAAVSR